MPGKAQIQTPPPRPVVPNRPTRPPAAPIRPAQRLGAGRDCCIVRPKR